MRLAITALIIVFTANLVGMYFELYDLPGFDVILHFWGGFFVALLFSQYLKQHFLPNSKTTNTLILVGSTVLIGVVWEFAEYLANHTIREPLQAAYGPKAPDFMGNLDDTISDLLIDMLGSITMAAYIFWGASKPIRLRQFFRTK